MRHGFARTIWTGTQLIVWGGERAAYPQRARYPMRGALWDPAAERWTRIPPPPIEPRRQSSVGWTGDALFVWGGTDAVSHRSDGALYRPGSGWTVLPAAPLSPRHAAAVAGSGDEVIVAGGWDNDGPLHDAAAFHLPSGQWRMLPPLPPTIADGLQLTSSRHGAVAWGDDQSGAGSRVLRHDPQRDRWRRLPGHGSAYLAGMVAAGDRLYAASLGARPQILELRHGRRTWRPIGELEDVEDWALQLVPAGRHLYVISANPGISVRRLDTRTHRWRNLPRLPGAGHEVFGAWTGDSLLIRTAGDPAGPGAAGPRLMEWLRAP